MGRKFAAAVACAAILGWAACAQAASAPVEAVLKQFADSGRFNGVVLISARTGESEARAYGVAERAFATTMRVDTRFKVASITKLFTSALVLDLVEEGKLRLDAPFGTYLPDYPGPGADRITLRQLLSHTSGLRQFDTVASFEEAVARGIPQYQKPANSADLLAMCCSGAVVAKPGERFDYNNADYIVLGRIIERATGRTFEAVLKDRILTPLKLGDTGLLHWDTPNDRLASTYFWRGDVGRLSNELPVYWENFYAAGGMYASADDVRRFADALFGGRIISGKMLAALLRPGLDEYGLGLWSYDFKRKDRRWRVAKRPGSIMGAQAVLYRLVDTGDTIVILANTNETDLDQFAQKLAEAIIDSK